MVGISVTFSGHAILALFCTVLSAHFASAGQPMVGTLGPCPDATVAEASQFKLVPVSPPRIEQLGELKLAGVNVSTQAHKTTFFQDIGKAFLQLSQHEASLKGIMVAPFQTVQSFGETFEIGVCFTQRGIDGFSFMPAVAVKDFGSIPESMNIMTLSPARYAVFTYKGTADGTGDFRYSITSDFFPKSALSRAPVPNLEISKAGTYPNDPNQTIEEWYPIQ